MESTLQLIKPAAHDSKSRYGNVVKIARNYVFRLYNEHLSGDHYFHTYTRAHQVVKACKEVARAMAITTSEREILLLAAWFADSGCVSTTREPTRKSADVAQGFLDDYGYPATKTEAVIICIECVHSTLPPPTHLAEIINDGYWLYLAKKEYAHLNELERAEQECLLGRTISDKEWAIECHDNFRQHPFHTEFAQHRYSQQRTENILAVNHTLRKLNHLANFERKTDEANHLSFREIEDAFKLTSRNYVNLVGVADRKAGLLIHVSSIIISIVLAVLLRHLTTNPMLMGPTVLLLIVCSATIAFAILGSRPTRLAHKSIDQTIEPVLFFGSFDKTDPAFERISWKTYCNQIEQLRATDKEALFNQMAGEVYQTRQLLSRKFRYLSYAYLTFLIGMVVTVLAYVLAALLQNPAT